MTSWGQRFFWTSACVFGASKFAGRQRHSAKHNRTRNLKHSPQKQKSKVEHGVSNAGGRRISRFGWCVCVTADVPSLPRSASLDAACVATQTAVSVSRLGSTNGGCGGVVSFEQFSGVRGVICFLPQLKNLWSLLTS